MSVYTMLTTPGLNEINSASPTGLVLEVAYWVTAYDKNLADDYDAELPISIENYTNSGDTYPNEGLVNTTATSGNQIFWHTSAGPDNESTPAIADLFSGVTYQSVVDVVSVESKGDWTSLMYSNPPVSNTGDWWTVVDAGSIDGTDFVANDIIAYNGDLYQKGTGGINENSRANFKLEIQDSEQTFYVNKIGVYGIKRNISGTQIGDPFLLGQVIIPETQVIKPFDEASFSVDMLTVDFQIDTEAVTIDFEDIMFSSQNDYWQTVVSNDGQAGLLYDGSVFITNTLGIRDAHASIPTTEDVGVAKTLISTFATVNKPNADEEADLPQLALQYTDTDVWESGTGFDARIRTTLRTNPDGNCEFNFYGACDTDYEYYALIPKHDMIFGLGNNDNRWRTLKTSKRIELYLGTEYDSGSDGRWDNISQTDKPGYMVFRNNDLSFNAFEGLAHFGNTITEVGPHHDYRDVSVETIGVNTFYNLPHKDNYFYAKGNISNYIAVVKENSDDANTISASYPLSVRSTNHMYMYTIAPDTIHKNEIDFGSNRYGDGYDSLAIQSKINDFIVEGTDILSTTFVTAMNSDDGLFSNFFSQGVWEQTVKAQINGTAIGCINSMRTNLFGSVEPIGYANDGGGVRKDVMITSSRYIYTNGDILCMVDGLNNIGSYGHEFRRVYTGGLVGAFNDGDTSGFTGNRYINVEGDLYPDDRGTGTGWIIGRGPATADSTTGVRWKEINADYLGNTDDRIDAGYIITVNTDRVQFKSNGVMNWESGWNMTNNNLIPYSDTPSKIGSESNPVHEIWATIVHTRPAEEYSVFGIRFTSTPRSSMSRCNASGTITFVQDVSGNFSVKFIFDNGYGAGDTQDCLLLSSGATNGTWVSNDNVEVGATDMINGYDMITFNVRTLLEQYLGTSFSWVDGVETNGTWNEKECNLAANKDNDHWLDRNGSWNSSLSTNGDILTMSTLGGSNGFGGSDLGSGARSSKNIQAAILQGSPSLVLNLSDVDEALLKSHFDGWE